MCPATKEFEKCLQEPRTFQQLDAGKRKPEVYIFTRTVRDLLKFRADQYERASRGQYDTFRDLDNSIESIRPGQIYKGRCATLTNSRRLSGKQLLYPRVLQS
jgi:hypothetical protein